MRRFAALLALAGVLAIILASPFADSRPVGAVRIAERISGRVDVPAQNVATATVYCPPGYVATAGEEFLGANDYVYGTTTQNRRGWTVAGGNPTTDNANHSLYAAVMCSKGTGKVTVKLSKVDLQQQAVRAYKRKLRASAK